MIRNIMLLSVVNKFSKGFKDGIKFLKIVMYILVL